jgi:hypothetical protein
MSEFAPLRVSPRRRPTLANTLEAHAEDVRVSKAGEATDFILILNTDQRLQVMTYGFEEDLNIVERLYEAIKLVRAGE